MIINYDYYKYLECFVLKLKPHISIITNNFDLHRFFLIRVAFYHNSLGSSFLSNVHNWLVVWVLWYINLCRLFNAKSCFMQILQFQIIPFSISTQFNCQKHFYFKQFSLFMQF